MVMTPTHTIPTQRQASTQIIPNESAISLSTEEVELADRISNWGIDFALERLVWERKLSLDQCLPAEREFKRFVFLIGTGVHPIAMISPKLDELWHQMVLFTRRYEVFCRETVGFFIHHTPETTEQPIPVQAAVNLMFSYEKLFGPLPPIWFRGLTREIRNQYQSRPFEKKPPVRWSGWTGEDRPV